LNTELRIGVVDGVIVYEVFYFGMAIASIHPLEDGRGVQVISYGRRLTVAPHDGNAREITIKVAG
jgi:hypothetical protein